MVLSGFNKDLDGSHPFYAWDSCVPLRLFKVEAVDWTSTMKLKYYGFSPEAAERFNPTAYTKRVDRYYGPEYIGKFDLGAEVYVWLAQSMMAYQGKYETQWEYVSVAQKLGMDDCFLDILSDPENFWILGAHNVFYWILLRIELAREKFYKLYYYQEQMHYLRLLAYKKAVLMEDPELEYEEATADIYV
ncbi:Protein of unknown function [Pyronema omphalodes CBS 100304]|uniref:Uncharacterized protein n=1 Tax=Pyronema omphalodes (strain CBS 100304) TaxID=1076935 RepID=U4LF23_PYROM|nr:Protein of unknown function [Pyronema omphalodes CBS 100304]